MKPIALTATLLCALAVTGSVVAADNPNLLADAKVAEQSSAMSLAFTRNMGQWPDSVLFRADAGEATMWFTRDGIFYQYSRYIQSPELSDGGSPDFGDRLMHDRDNIEISMIKAVFIGANPYVELIGLDELNYKCNYFLGNDPTRRFVDVPNYSGVTFKELYPGVDVTIRSRNGRVEYEVASSNSSALAQVQVDYHGAEGVNEQPDGTVLVNTAAGEKRFIGAFPAESNTSAVFNTPTSLLSPSNMTLMYSTYLGGSLSDYGYGIAMKRR